ncbi:glutamyl-tRNA reductase [Xanthomonas campestris]|uniref:Glutamyl-tRNA reductase n=1 Tax=Xanthomonas campestris pv. campestris (strain B100) TaxID=509169 RepID=HEM1_XANCB|nr:glutamyl-tRNA reductase [Xanthomonas campestris]B0RUA4.1 RecName: Full=Glutamyl-tRNA reductase; Short=GluTR [Xanthomonas campestris pv. campestris str. B100]AKS17272.1 glutamyl-tRNA reductase [Xanthomonas campestris pv. campestris]MBF9173089.1 glutamyl-tRNA reductase [Xanthomonas campestris pv. campestris]MCC5046187.1 glutamyl-tRNA reductase [Xanthomonas campestris]MCC5054492.1 glutamyl-tRNA reductase [Xanthomonas campestris]MCC5058205.1 glutamyl-tRNA reductase [Xanthomonas campestris]
MTLWVLGLNHQTAPVDLRERAAFAGDALPRALDSLRTLPQVREAALLSTCNRTELYAMADDPQTLVAWLDMHAPGLSGYLYQHRDAEAVRHLFRVATGLDSMVLGEPQILGQVKDAWAVARAHGALGSGLDRLFQQTFSVAKRARTDTRVGANPVSVASTAVRLAQESFARLNESTVLLVGAGETIELAAKHLSEGRVRRLLIANRTLAHAQTLATQHGGVALPLTELDRHLAEADVVFSATAAREPVVTRVQVEQALRTRKRKPMLLFDLAVPRDIEASVAELSDAYLYTVDDLERAVEDNRRSRREAADQAEAIIDLQVARYVETLQANERQAPLKRLRAFGDSTRDELLAKARQQLSNGKPADEVLEQLAHALTNRLLHPPTAALRDAALNNDLDLTSAADRLFPEKPGYRHPPVATPIVRTDDANPAP